MVLAYRILKRTLGFIVVFFCVLLALLLLVDRDMPAVLQPDSGAATIYIIRGASVLTMEQNQASDDWTVVVEEGVITALGLDDSIVAPDGAEVIDGRGKTLLPGLIDMHVHLYDEAGFPRVFLQ